MHLKEHQEIIDKLRGIVSEKAEEISNMQMDLENSNAKLQEKVLRGVMGLICSNTQYIHRIKSNA